MNIVPLGGSLTYPILIVAVLFSVAIWGTICDKKLSGIKKWTLFALRLFTIAVLFWILLRPTVVTTVVQRDSSSAIILLDNSRSMTVSDAGTNKQQTRYANAVETLTQNADSINRLKSELDLKFYTFDSGLKSAGEDVKSFPAQPTGHMTAIGKSLDDLIRQEAGKRVLGVFVLSDGAQRLPIQNESGEIATLPQMVAQSYKRLGIPLYPICFGQPEGKAKAIDVALVDLNVPPRVFLKSSALIEGQIRVDGVAGVDIPVRLLFETESGKMEQVAQTTVRADESGQVLPISFVYEPQAVGEFKVTVEVPSIEQEEKSDNNSMDAFISVIDGGLNVLYIEGTIRPEQKFICRDFEDSPYAQLDVIRLNRKGTGADSLEEQLEKNEYDAIILGDVHSTFLSESVQNKIVELVKGGAGLFLLGGFNAYGPGGYAEAPLSAVIPITMDRFERQNPNDVPASDLHIDKPIRLQPTNRGKTSPVLAVNDSNPTGIWNRMPPLDGANKWQGVKPGVDILAVTADKTATPILVASQVGKGRVLAFAADSTWRWTLAGFGAEHQRFWIQSVFWLAQKEKTKDNRIQITVDKRRVPCGGKITFSADAVASDGKPVDASCFKIEVKTPDNKTIPVAMHQEDNRMTAVFAQSDKSGDYQYIATAVRDGETLGKVQGRFQTYTQDVELDDPASDPETLKQIASVTGGKVLEPVELSNVLNRLANQAQTLEIQTETLRSLWDTLWIMLILFALMSVEWTLRKLWTNV